MSLGEYIGAGSGQTKLLLHFNGNSNDSSGNSNNGTDTSVTNSLANGKFRQGAGYAGNPSITRLAAPSVLSTFTFSFMVKTTNHSSVTGQIYEQRPTADNANIDLVVSSNKLRLQSWNGITTVGFSSSKSVNDGVIHNCIATRNGANAKLYIDGSLDASSASFPSYNIGANEASVGAHPGPADWFNGSLDEGIIENIVWDDSRIKKHNTYIKGRFGII